MSAVLAANDWTEANQRLLNAELARLKQRLGAEGDARMLECACEAARAAMPSPAAIDHLTAVFGLSPFERDILLMCAGAELDAQFAYRCEIANEESRRSGTTFGLALSGFGRAALERCRTCAAITALAVGGAGCYPGPLSRKIENRRACIALPGWHQLSGHPVAGPGSSRVGGRAHGPNAS